MNSIFSPFVNFPSRHLISNPHTLFHFSSLASTNLPRWGQILLAFATCMRIWMRMCWKFGSNQFEIFLALIYKKLIEIYKENFNLQWWFEEICHEILAISNLKMASSIQSYSFCRKAEYSILYLQSQLMHPVLLLRKLKYSRQNIWGFGLVSVQA